MSVFLQLIFLLSIILLLAKAAGYLSTLLGQPSVLGELLVGIVLGPSLLNITHLPFITEPHLETTIIELGEIGVLMLMFLAGLELHISDLTRNTRVSVFGGLLGVLFPLGFGYLFGYFTGMTTNQAIFLGLTLGATSVSISAQTLIELNRLRTRVGLGLLGAAVIDDVMVILLLSSFLALASGAGGLIQILLVLGKMILFLGLSVAFGLWILPKITSVTSRLSISKGVLTLSVIVLLFYGLAAEIVGGMAAITGSFIAGLMFARTLQKREIEEGMRSIAYAFFVPIFFITIGLDVNVRELSINALWIMLLMSLVAVFGKLIGTGLGALVGGFSMRESIQLGIGMVSRGEVGLIVAKVGIDIGMLNNEIFSIIVGMVLVTTLITPPLLRLSFMKEPAQAPDVSG